MTHFSFRERFIGTTNFNNGGLYAPLTIGSPGYVIAIDRSVFKMTKGERDKTIAIKAKFREKEKINGKQKMRRYAKFST